MDNFEQLLPAAIAGDRSAREALLLTHYDQLNRRLKRKLAGKLSGTHASEDILQEALIVAIRDFSVCKATSEASFAAWLNAVADNRLRDIRKRAYAQKRGGAQRDVALPDGYRSSMVGLLEVLEQDQASPSSRVARGDAVKALHVGIASLPNDQRDAIERRFLAGDSIQSVADKMKKTPAAVRALIHRGKQALRMTMGQSVRWFDKK